MGKESQEFFFNVIKGHLPLLVVKHSLKIQPLEQSGNATGGGRNLKWREGKESWESDSMTEGSLIYGWGSISN